MSARTATLARLRRRPGGRGRSSALVAAAATLAASLALVASAAATPVLVLQGRTAAVRDNPYLPAADLPAPRPVATAARARHRPAAALRALKALLAGGQIDSATYSQAAGAYRAAARSAQRLRGTRAAELGAVVANVDAIAAAGALTPDRLPVLTLTLARNRQWWTTGPIPAANQRVQFDGSQLVWEYYPGQGVEIQVLGSFGEANGLWSAARDDMLRALLDELVPLAVHRAGGVAWEYYFTFEGGRPPWVSAISEGTAIQALARASTRLSDPSLAALGESALGVFERPPPAGVRIDLPAGPHYLIYSFAPRERVLNAFLQALIGLYDFAQTTGDPTALSLFQQGDAEAQLEVPSYDTGAWSLYDLTQESDLSYHELVTGFLSGLCKRTGAPVYCQTASRFSAHLHTAPTVRPVTTRVRAGRPAALWLTLDKISSVRVIVTGAAGTIFSIAATLPHGEQQLTWPHPGPAGDYTLTIAATDLAGNQSQASGPLTVLHAPRRPHRRH